MEEYKGGTPVFVKIDEYKEILDVMDLIKNKLDQVRSVLKKIEELKAQEDTEIQAWHNDLEEVEKKIAYIDGELFQPEGL